MKKWYLPKDNDHAYLLEFDLVDSMFSRIKETGQYAENSQLFDSEIEAAEHLLSRRQKQLDDAILWVSRL